MGQHDSRTAQKPIKPRATVMRAARGLYLRITLSSCCWAIFTVGLESGLEIECSGDNTDGKGNRQGRNQKRAEALRMAGSVSRGELRVSGRLEECRRSEEGKSRRAEKLKTAGPLSLTAFANSLRQLVTAAMQSMAFWKAVDGVDGVRRGGKPRLCN